MAVRIKARAIDRCGELLKEIDAQGKRTDLGLSTGNGTKSQREAVQDAGLSKRQQVTAVRVSNVPRSQFEALVESDKPPFITTLAQTDFKKSTRAQLPAVYEKAKIALKECAQIDECQQCADRAKALASYAKDETAARHASARAWNPRRWS